MRKLAPKKEIRPNLRMPEVILAELEKLLNEKQGLDKEVNAKYAYLTIEKLSSLPNEALGKILEFLHTLDTGNLKILNDFIVSAYPDFELE